MDKLVFEDRMREKDKSYSESFAKALITLAVDSNFIHAQNADRPDLQCKTKDCNVGIEVTRLICSYFVSLKRHTKAWSHKKMSLEEIVESLPYELRNALGINGNGKVVPLKSLGEKTGSRKMKKQIAHIYKTKLDKLQNYDEFDENDLFIFATELNQNMTQDKIGSALKHMVDTREYQKTYDKVFVFTYNNLMVFDMKHHHSKKMIAVSEETRNICDKYAKQMAKHKTSQVLNEYFANQELEK